MKTIAQYIQTIVSQIYTSPQEKARQERLGRKDIVNAVLSKGGSLADAEKAINPTGETNNRGDEFFPDKTPVALTHFYTRLTTGKI